jgi:hypothetical protein
LLKLQLNDSSAVLPKTKQTWLPLLVVLFMLAYGLMTMLIVEQGHTIDAQRNLIRQLFSDSTELTAMKGKTGQKQQGLIPPAPPVIQAAPSAPPHLAAPPNKDKSARNAMKRPPMPKPPRDASEMADERRSLLSI